MYLCGVKSGRHAYAEVVTDQKIATWLGCHRRAFEWFNGVPGRLTIDNPKCAITRACYHDPEVQRAYRSFRRPLTVLFTAVMSRPLKAPP